MRPADAWLFVLARDPRGAKTRLAPLLDESARAALATAMLEDVLAAASAIPFARRIVVTESDAVRAIAARAGYATLDAPPTGTNDAALAALRAASEGRAPRALILAADLPLLGAADLEAMLALGAAVVIAPDRRGQGTNALLLTPPLVITPAFGSGSHREHVLRAQRAAVTVAEISRDGLADDIDEPGDLDVAAGAAAVGRRTAAILARSSSPVRIETR